MESRYQINSSTTDPLLELSDGRLQATIINELVPTSEKLSKTSILADMLRT